MKPQKPLLICIVILSVVEGSFSQGTWTSKTSLPAVGRYTAVAFSIGTKGYLGTGKSSGPFLDDFWEYDPAVNVWTQMANFGGGVRGFAVGFSIGNKGYLGTGMDGVSLYNDFWQYDPVTNAWAQVASFGGVARVSACGFSVGGNGYVVTGNGNQDSWKYNPVTNTWMQLVNFPGGLRLDIDHASFVIGNKAYMGTGQVGLVRYKDLWEYDPATDTWTQKANLPAIERVGATGFSICNKGFLGLGEPPPSSSLPLQNDLWMYDPVTNLWSIATSMPTAGRYDAPAFVINNKAYIGTGIVATSNDLWEFTPDSVISGGNVIAAIASSSNTICSGQSVTLSASGGSTYSWSNGSANNPIVVFPTATTTYSVIVSDTSACGGSDMAAVTISVINVTAAIACQNICAGSSATLFASGGTNYLWSNGAVTSSVTVSPAATTSYSVIVNIGNCADTANCTVNVFPVPLITTNSITDVSCNGGNDGSAAITVNGGTSPYMYNWSPSGGTNQVSTGLNAGTYLVTVIDANGCKQVQTITIAEPALVQLAVPNAFSPNNDGENDELCLQGGMDDCIQELKIIIYDRWGQKVYESSDKNFCWDGTYKGSRMNSAVFVYYLEANLISGETITKKGNVSLMR